jgi:hypothetical protein
MSVLSDLAVLAEERTDEYAQALNDCAHAEAAYLRAYFIAIAESDPSLSNAARERFAESVCVDEKIAWVHAQAAERRCKQAVVTTLARLSAAQSYYRMVEKQT